MNATDFIKKHGLRHAKEQCAIHGWKNTSWWIQVKNLIQSHEIINHFGGLDNAKKVAGLKGGYLGCKFDDVVDLKLHIADVEACQGAAQ